MTGIQDSEFRAVDESNNRRWAIQEQQKHAAEGSLRDQAMVAHWETSISNPQRQVGKLMGFREVETKLKKLNPNLRIVLHPNNPQNKALVYLGNQELFPCEALMPEWSVWSHRMQENPLITDKPISLDEDSLPTIMVPHHEVIRGWRTVLLKLIKLGHINPVPTDKIFGGSMRPSWMHHTGRQKIQGVTF